MSSTSFLSSARKGHGNTSSRVLKELANKVQKLYTANVVLEEEGLLDSGRMTKGRLLVQDKLHYTRKIITIPSFYVPIEPDHDKLTFWIKSNHTGLNLQDISTFDNVILCNNDRHLCLVDGGGLDVGYLGKYAGVNSSPAWRLNGENETAEVTDNTRLQVKTVPTGFNVAAWVKVSDFSQDSNGFNRRILAKKDDTNNAYVLSITNSNKAVWAVKFAGTEYKVETPATLAADTWYFIAGTFNSATPAAIIYLNAVASTTAHVATVTYPTVNTNMQLFGNGNDGHLGDIGAFAGYVRDIRIYREQLLSATDITRFNTNRNTISNILLGEVTIAGYTWTPGDMALSSFTTTSFTTTSFNT